MADNVVGIEDVRRPPGAEQGGEAGLALDIGEGGKVLAVDLEGVEQEEVEASSAFGDRLLQRREAALALFVEADDLAIEQSRIAFDSARRLDDLRKLLRPVEPRTRVDLGPPAADREQAAIAVIFDLVDPAGALRHVIDQRRLLRLAKGGGLARFPGGRGPLGRRLLPRRRLQPLGPARQLFRLLRRGDLLHRAAGLDRGEIGLGQPH